MIITKSYKIYHICVYKSCTLHMLAQQNTPHISACTCKHSESHSKFCVFTAKCFVVSTMLLPPVSTCRSKEILKCYRRCNEFTVHRQL